jgi:haloalkane dehalogenase
MMKRIREKRPQTRIVIGGYGVSTLGQPVPGDKDGDAVYIRENADHLCREEGVRFMRRILNDGPEDREITQYHLPLVGFSVAGLKAQLRLPIMLVSLGCPNGCDFCNTSAFFYQKKIYVAEPEQIYRYIQNYQKRLGSENLFVLLFDEDLFLNPEYVRELGRLLRSDRKTWGVRYFAFGSMRSLAAFEPEELRDCGLGVVWIGVESFLCGQNLSEDRYGKRTGKEIKETFAALHKNGIGTIGSLVLGFDFHDSENLKEDVDQFVALKPTFYQLSPLTPCPGTALYDRMLEEDRILDTYKWEDFHLWKDDVFKLKNLQPGEVKHFFDYAHDKIRDELGPPVVQGLEMMLDGYQTINQAPPSQFHTYKARQNKMAAKAMHTYLGPLIKLHPSPAVRERARMLDRRFHEELGRAIPFSGLVDRYITRKLKKTMAAPPPPVVSDPPVRWSYYHTFDDRVWVRKGRKTKKAAPYRNGWAISRT